MTLREIDRDGVLPKIRIDCNPNNGDEVGSMHIYAYNECLSEIESIGVEVDIKKLRKLLEHLLCEKFEFMTKNCVGELEEFTQAIASSPNILKLVRQPEEGKK